MRPIVLAIVYCVMALHLCAATVEVRVRDVITHNGISATLTVEGPESRSFVTNASGHYSIDLSPGEYRVEFVARGYKSLRTEHVISAGKVNNIGASLDPERSPAEERPENIEQQLRPGYTLIHEYVADARTGEPLAGVTVRAANAQLQTETDSTGHFSLPIPTPPPPFPGGAGTDTITYQKKGYKTLVLRNFIIATEDIGGNAIDLEAGSGTISIDATHKLLRDGDAPAEKPQANLLQHAHASGPLAPWISEPGTAFSVGGSSVSTAAVVVPTSIKVGHNCVKTICSTWDPPISLEQYVSNGLPGEWIVSWATDSLKSGAVAYRSYGAWFVAHALSSNYDICDNTYCQVYNPTSFPSNNKSRSAVTATAGVVLTSNSAVLKAEYAAESNLADDLDSNGQPLATCGDGRIGEPTQNWPCMKDPACTGTKTKEHAFTGHVPARLTTMGIRIGRDWRCRRYRGADHHSP